MLFYQIEATADNIVKILPQKETWDSLETVRTKVERYRKEETLGALWGFLFLESYQPDTIFLGAAMSDPLCREHLAFLYARSRKSLAAGCGKCWSVQKEAC